MADALTCKMSALYFADLVKRQNNLRMTLSNSGSSVNLSIGHVFGSGSPPKIGDVVIGPVTIVVGAINTLWGCATKCGQYQAVNVMPVSATKTND